MGARIVQWAWEPFAPIWEGDSRLPMDLAAAAMRPDQWHIIPIEAEDAIRAFGWLTDSEVRDGFVEILTELARLDPNAEFRVVETDDGLDGVKFPNVCLMVTVRNPEEAGLALSLLSRTPCGLRAVRYIPEAWVDFSRVVVRRDSGSVELDALNGELKSPEAAQQVAALDWLVVEKHPTRPTELGWIAEASDAAEGAGVAVWDNAWPDMRQQVPRAMRADR